ncbi:hypothetical protein D3C84_769320 [compost metagenome]
MAAPEGSPRKYSNLGVYASGLSARVAVSSARRMLLRAGMTRRIGRLGAPLTFCSPAKLNSICTGAYRSLRTYTLSTPFFLVMTRYT